MCGVQVCKTGVGLGPGHVMILAANRRLFLVLIENLIDQSATREPAGQRNNRVNGRDTGIARVPTKRRFISQASLYIERNAILTQIK